MWIDRVRSMALIHETLYGSHNLAQVNFAGYLETRCRHLFQSFGAAAAGITWEPRLDKVVLALDQAVPCGLLVNELVSNALKHAFPAGRSGQVNLELRLHQGQVCLRVGDNGVGLPPALEVQQTSTLGLRLVHLLAQQLKAAVVVERAPGTTFQVTFPFHPE